MVQYKSRNSGSGRKISKQGKKGVIRWVLMFLFVFLGAVFLMGNRSVIDLFELKHQSKQLTEQEQQLVQEKEALKNEIDKLQNDKKYIEKVAREKYNMKKEKESVYHIKKK